MSEASDRLARTLAELDRRLRDVERGSQAGLTSIEREVGDGEESVTETLDVADVVTSSIETAATVEEISATIEDATDEALDVRNVADDAQEAADAAQAAADAVAAEVATIPDQIAQAKAEAIAESGGGMTDAERADLATAKAFTADGAVTATHIADDAITTSKILAGAIVAGKIATGAVNADAIAAGAIVAGKIAADAVLADNIKAGEITATQMKAGTITAASGIIGSIDAAKITVGTITAAQLAATAIDGKTITGSTLKTAASGERVEVIGGTSTSSNVINFFGPTSTAPVYIKHSETVNGTTDGVVVETPSLDMSATLGTAWRQSGYASVNPAGSSWFGVRRFNPQLAVSGLYSGVVASPDYPLEVRGPGISLFPGSGSVTIKDASGVTAQTLEDTGWIAGTMTSGVTVGGGVPIAGRRINGVVYLRGNVVGNYGTVNAFYQVGTLPVGLRPSTTSTFAASANSTVDMCIQIAADGRVFAFTTTSTAAWITFNNAVYPAA